MRQDQSTYGHLHALVAEDDVLIAIDLEQTLIAHFGLRVTLAHNLGDALAVVRRDPPNLAILDFDLAGSGVEPLVKTFAETETPMVFVSGYRSHPLEALGRGWKLEKPHSSEQLIEVVGKAIRAAGR